MIGLRIEGLTPQALNALVDPFVWGAPAWAHSAGVAQPAIQVLAPSGSVVIGGGFRASAYAAPFSGQFGTASAPIGDGYQQCDRGPNGWFDCQFVVLNVTGWRSESKDHVIAAPGNVFTQVMALPPTISVGGTTFNVQARLVSATSSIAAHPATDVSGLRGELP